MWLDVVIIHSCLDIVNYSLIRQALLRDVALPAALQPSDAGLLALSRTDVCGKMCVLSQLLAVWRAESAKVLLFSSSRELLDIIARSLVADGRSFLRLDGATPAAQRAALADQFNRDAAQDLFLISTTAGGVGLNLTGANVVVIFDPNWNPGV